MATASCKIKHLIMSMKKEIGMLALLASMMDNSIRFKDDSNNGDNPLKPEDIDVTPKETPIPKGCKRHYFDKHGECPKGKHLVYFDAMKRKSAIEKWERWINNQ